MSRTSMKGFVYRQYTSDGLFVADYKSSREASEKVGTSANSVVRATHGERKTGGGFIWKRFRRIRPRRRLRFPMSLPSATMTCGR